MVEEIGRNLPQIILPTGWKKKNLADIFRIERGGEQDKEDDDNPRII